MPKIKSRKAFAKRFKVTGTGKVKRRRAGRGHLLTKKTRKRKRQLRRRGTVSKAQEKTIRMFLPR